MTDRQPTVRTTACPSPDGDGVPERLRIQVLGGFCVSAGDITLPADSWRSWNATRLVKRLALEPDYALLREQLIDLLWPDAQPAAAANSLRQTVHLARRQLQRLPLDPSQLLMSRGERIQLYSPECCVTDAGVFVAAAHACRGSDDPAPYWAAIDCYEGPLLPTDLYVEWTIPRREALQSLYVDLLDAVAALHETRAEPARAIAALRRLVALEPAHEAAHIRLMRLLVATGNRPAALAQYRQLEDALDRAFELSPEPETQALYQSIKASGGRGQSASAAQRSLDNLPHDVSRFIGRAYEVTAVLEQLGRHRLLTLSGPGGIGKTRLVLEVARRASTMFADGVWLVRLATVSEPAMVAQAVVDALGIEEGARRTPLETLLATLHDADLLLVLDNCEHLVGAAAELAATLLHACPALRILATSRELLGVPGERSWAVPALALPALEAELNDAMESDAAQLFLDRLALSRPEEPLTPEDLTAVGTICRRLDGLPLALELAAARAAILPLPQLAARLDDALGLLTGGARQAPTRQQTLRATLDWSYQLLTEDERVLFRRLAVFANGWTLAMAEAICTGDGLAPSAILDLHAQLVAKSLLQTHLGGDEARYRLLEPVRQYAAELLDACRERDQLDARQATYFADFVEAIETELSGPAQAGWFARLEQENDNIRSTLNWAIQRGEAEIALRIEAVLWRYWGIRWYSAAGLTLIEETLALPVAVPTRARAWALLGAGELARRILDFERALALLEASLEVQRALGDTGGIAWTLAYLANTALVADDFERARRCATESLQLFQARADQAGIARALNILAEDARLHDDYATAGRFYRAALEIDRARGDQQSSAIRLHNLGYVALHGGDVALAARSFAEAQELDQQLGYRTGPLSFLEGMAAVLSVAGRFEASARLFGAWEANCAQPGTEFKLHPPDQREFDRYQARVSTALGPAGFARAWEAGRRLSLEDAVAEALDAPNDPPSAAGPTDYNA